MPKRERHRAPHLGVVDREPAGETLGVEGEGELAGDRDHERVADARPTLAVGHPTPECERARGVVEALRLHRPQRHPRERALQRQRHAGDEAAAAAGAEHGVGGDADLGELSPELEPHGALAGDDVEVVVGPHQGGALIRHQPLADLLATFRGAVVEHHLGAQAPGAGELHRGRVARHDDGGGSADQGRRRRHTLGVVARRVGDHAAPPLILRKPADAVVGAAELERPGALQHLALDQHAPAHDRVEPFRLEHRGGHRQALEPGRRLDHVAVAGERARRDFGLSAGR